MIPKIPLYPSKFVFRNHGDEIRSSIDTHFMFYPISFDLKIFEDKNYLADLWDIFKFGDFIRKGIKNGA